MGNKAKVAVVILVVLFIFALALAGGGFYLFQQEHNKNIILQGQLDDLKERHRITENQLQESKKTVSDLEVKLKDAQSQIDSISGELKQEKASKEEALSKISQLNTDLQEQKTMRADLESKLTGAQDEISKSQTKLKDTDAQRAQLENKIKDLETQARGVELGKIVVTPEAKETKQKEMKANKNAAKGKTAKPIEAATKAAGENKAVPANQAGLEGKILVVNNEYNFAVLNLGIRDGVNVGDLFSAYHGDNYIGDLKVEKLHDSMSAANFVNADLKDRIAEGDKVVQKVK